MLKYNMLEIKQCVKNLVELHSALEIYSEKIQNNHMNQNDSIIESLTSCQETMIKIDEIIETSEGANVSFIHDMERYCESIYLLSQNLLDKNQWIKDLDDLKEAFYNIQKGIDSLQIKKEIVFFPYKASMWDSLESIWIAANKDQECAVYVVPIPYYERNEEGKFISEKYEIKQFPSYVPVMDYREYSVSIRRPDIAYIHNPYDQYNIVTSVHPDYYSVELKKHVNKLVYVPYFLSFNAVSYSHRDMPCYYRVDNIVVQSEKMTESFAPTISLEKFVPMGSPIVDRILNLDNNKPEIPEEWKVMLPNGKDFGGKTVVMYNTSLSMLMREKKHFLNKIDAVINSFCKNNDIFVVWRPHPLMHATLQRLGDQYYNRFLELEKKFLENKIGILDKTADVGVAIALCDAYVGEDASSIVNMFGIAGKPRFLITMKQYQDKDVCSVKSFGKCVNDNKAYFVVEEYRLLCSKNLLNDEVEVIAKIPGTKLYPYEAYRDIYVANDNVYIQPYSGEGLCIYNLKNQTFRKIYMKDSIPYGFERMVYADGGLYLVPGNYEKVVRFDMMTEAFSYFEKEDVAVKDILAEVSENKNSEIFNNRLPMDAVHKVRAEEIKERTWGTGTMYENDDVSLQDYLFYITVEGLHVKENTQAGYKTAINNFDGTCGQKVHEFIKSRV